MKHEMMGWQWHQLDHVIIIIIIAGIFKVA